MTDLQDKQDKKTLSAIGLRMVEKLMEHAYRAEPEFFLDDEDAMVYSFAVVENTPGNKQARYCHILGDLYIYEAGYMWLHVKYYNHEDKVCKVDDHKDVTSFEQLKGILKSYDRFLAIDTLESLAQTAKPKKK